MRDMQRYEKAWELRKEGMTYREIGIEIGNRKNGDPICRETVRGMCARMKHIEQKRSRLVKTEVEV